MDRNDKTKVKMEWLEQPEGMGDIIEVGRRLDDRLETGVLAPSCIHEPRLVGKTFK